MRFLDLCAGVGGFRLGMSMAGHKCRGYVEWNKYARRSYESIHDTNGEWTANDITTVTDAELQRFKGNVECICAGFPCQAFSVAGRRMGFEDTRGTLFFDIIRFAKVIRPRFLFLENVKGLLNHEKGQTYGIMLQALDELGYDAEWQVLNSKNFGIPQNRDRVFIIAHLRGHSGQQVFPLTGIGTKASCQLVGMIDRKGKDQIKRVYSPNGLSPTLTTMQGGGQEPKIAIREATKQGYALATVGDSVNYSLPNSKTRRGRVGSQIANTLDTGCQQAVVTEEYKIRKLTPRECWRLQGFPDWAFDRAAEVTSDSQLYKQAGNSVTVNVIHAIATRLGEIYEYEQG